MCLLCAEADGDFAGFALMERPPETLAGLWWDGTHVQAAAGGVRATLRSLQAIVGKGGLWSGPIVGLTFSDGPDGLRHFAGVAVEDLDAPSGSRHDLVRLDLPGRRYAASWHGVGDGDVVAHYGRMIHWVAGQGLSRPLSGHRHREEYPRDVDFDGPAVLRLMLPVD